MNAKNFRAGCETSILPERDSQQEYWNANLDAQNLGGAASVTTESLVEELKFSNTPDIRDMIAHVDAAAGKTILELGAGLGANTVLMARAGARVIALDIAQDRLLALRQRTDKLRGVSWGAILPVKAKAEALPFKPGSFDGACCRAVLIHTELDKALAETSRALRSGAPFAFSEPMAHNPFVNLYRAALAPREWRSITTYFTNCEIAIVHRYFPGAGSRKYYGISFLAFVFQYALSWPRWFYCSLNALGMVDRMLVRIMPSLSRFAWFVLITGFKSKR